MIALMDDERPIECGGCKKPLAVHYKEIVDGTVNSSKMCNECPILEKKLRGGEASVAHSQNLCCHACHTTYDEVTENATLGCPECYHVFEGAILTFLKKGNLIAPHMGASLHIGKSPSGAGEPDSFQKVMELSDELNKALSQENYEEAAWLRDQIKTMKEVSDDPSDD